MIKKPFYIFGLATLAFLSACQPSPDREQILLGKWKVKWSIKKDKDFDPSMALHMDGSADFSEDGSAKITAFGYQGCIFGNDTIKNELIWRVKENRLHLVNQLEKFELKYDISELSEDKVKLQLLDDISLELRRNTF